MDFGFTPENGAFRREVRQFIAEHVTPDAVAPRRAGAADPEFFRKMADSRDRDEPAPQEVTE